MPTKKRRVGFIPRSNVLDIINKLSIKSNLSISKIINILVEEALYKRGIFNIKTGKVIYDEEKTNLSNVLNIFKNSENQNIKERSDELFDNEIYEKFLIFLQFQEKMKNKN